MVYNPLKPAPNDDLDVSVTDIQQNFLGANTSFTINHYAFDNLTANNGKHKFIDIPVGTIPTIALGDGGVYTKTANTASQLFYTPDASTNEYQLTRTIASKYASFGNLTVFDVTQPMVTGGWTFLPGGMLLQYGVLTSPVNNDVIKFPVSFTSFAIVTLGAVRSNTSDKAMSIRDGTTTISQFQIILSGSDLPTGLYWQAVGV